MTVRGAEAEPDAVPLRNRDGRGFELELGRDDVDRLDVLDARDTLHLSRPRPGRHRAESEQKNDHVSFQERLLRNPIVVAAALVNWSPRAVRKRCRLVASTPCRLSSNGA